jgi:sirohydrochlorin cobaltochelatase
VSDEGFRNDVLVLFGHGTTRNADSSAPVYQHAAELRRRGLFAEVREAFWKQDPRLVDVVAGVKASRLFLAPLFISEGYFSEEVIPKALGFASGIDGKLKRIRRHGAQEWYYCKPVGTHETMTGVLLARVREVVQHFPFPRAPAAKDITVFIAGHGTEENDNSRTAIESQVELLRSLKIYADVHAVFMEEEPRLQACYTLAKTRNIVVVPFFISDGLHVREDIPVLLGEPEGVVRQRLTQKQATWRNPTEKHGKLVWYAQSVGTEALVADVLLERVREAARWSQVALAVPTSA